MSRIAIVDGIRTPFVKSWTLFKDIPGQELGRIVVNELLQITEINPDLIDEVIIGTVAQPAEASNIARVISLYAGIPVNKPAYTISRNCSSGIESVTSAAEKITLGLNEIVIAGGVESMSNIPMLYTKKIADIFLQLSRARKFLDKLKLFLKLNPKYLLKPEIGLKLGLIDIVCGLNMGETAEVLAKEFGITRKEQDEFAFLSHKRAVAAKEKLRSEIVPVIVPPEYKLVVENDKGPRENETIEELAKLKPVFDKYTGTVTAGNSSQITDGAVALLLMKEEKAKEFGFKPLGYIRAYSNVGLDPKRMGLGPAYAIPAVLKKSGLSLSNIELIEINEAFAAQVIASERLLEKSGYKINREILNVNGGSIALGHPVGATGTRLILTILKEMKRKDLHTGLISLCVGGGQGAAIVLER